MSEESKLQLQWCGRSHGPWTYAEIQSRLSEGVIHSMYQIRIDDTWLSLREYNEKMESAELQRRATAMAASIRSKETETAGMVRDQGVRPPDRRVKIPNPFANPPPVFVKGANSGLPSAGSASDAAPTCWLAVAAFVVSCCSFVPYLNLVSWLPSLVLGHLALAQIRRDPYLEGRGLALGAVVIAYAMLAFAALSFLLFPNLFYRVFPISG